MKKTKMDAGRTKAWIITAALIIISIIINDGQLINSRRTAAEDIFYSGVSGDYDSIQSELDKRCEYADRYIKVAGKYLAGDKALDGLKSAQAALLKAKNIGQKYDANRKLTDAYTELYNKLLSADMDEKDAGYRRSIYVDMEASNDIISHNPYNIEARHFNESLKNFPGNIWKMLGIVKELELFNT